MSENVKVMIRCRPFNSKETNKNNIVSIDKDAHTITISRPKNAYEQQRIFTFDNIFSMDATQE